MGIVRAVLRGVPIAVLMVFGLIALGLCRLIERPFFGARRPLSARVVKGVCRVSIWIMGITYEVKGAPMTQPGAVVANHSSWLDIFALNASDMVFFISKAEVASWPGIGAIARAAGTMFIKRDRREAAAHTAALRDRLLLGHRLLFFPEGTSTDGRRVLPFKATLFAAFFDPALRDKIWVQPVSVVYQAPEGANPRLYGWWGDMEFGPHLLHTLAARRQGRITVIRHAPLRVADFESRRALAQTSEAQVRAPLAAAGVLAT